MNFDDWKKNYHNKRGRYPSMIKETSIESIATLNFIIIDKALTRFVNNMCIYYC